MKKCRAPVKLNSTVKLEGSDRATVPALHEFGGVAVISRRKSRRRARYAADPDRLKNIQDAY